MHNGKNVVWCPRDDPNTEGSDYFIERKTLTIVTKAFKLTFSKGPLQDEHPDGRPMCGRQLPAGNWWGHDWGELVLNQAEGNRALKGQCEKWDVHGVVSGNRVFLLFSSYGDVAYSAVLTAAGDKVLDGSFSKGLKAEDTKGKTMHLTKD